MLRLLSLIPIVLLHGVAAAHADVPRYFIAFDAQMAHAEVRLCLDHARARVAFAPDAPRALRYLSAMRRSAGGELEASASPWRAQDWHAGECLEYTADIGAIADQHSDVGTRYGGNVVTDPQHWLLRADAQGVRGAEATVELPRGWTISTPWSETGRDGSTIHFHIPDTPPDWSASMVLGHFEEQRIELPGGVLRVALLSDADERQRGKLTDWLRKVGQALLSVTGRLPLADVQVWMVSVDDLSIAFRFAAFLHPAAVLAGESARGQGNALQLVVNPGRPESEFTEDWTAVHELSHLLHPYLGDRGSWLGEGLATYYQNVLRGRAGLLTPARAWERLALGFQRAGSGIYPDTLEQAAADISRGNAFLRVYWSGAAYWLTVDADLRRASGGRLNLDTALARFGACCLPSYREWKPQAFVAKLDALLGVRTFSSRYREFARLKRFPDWQALLGRLGVHARADDTVTFDSGAPDAAIRDAITAPVSPDKHAASGTLSPPRVPGP